MPRASDLFGIDSAGRMRCRITADMPPSDNKLYWNLPTGGRALTAVGKKFKNHVKSQVASLAAKSSTHNADFVSDVPYEVHIYVYFKELFNATYGAKHGAKTRYKKQDVSNRQKLALDAVMEAIGVDDRHIVKHVMIKKEDINDPRIVVVVRERNPKNG